MTETPEGVNHSKLQQLIHILNILISSTRLSQQDSIRSLIDSLHSEIWSLKLLLSVYCEKSVT